jgi:phosphoglycerate dehydrogenase-like enzyme
MKNDQEKNIEVLITFPLAEEIIQQLAATSKRLHIYCIPAHHANEISDEIWRKIEVLITEKILPPPEKAPSLRWIQFNYAGIDFVLDEPIVQIPEMLLTTLSGAAAPQVAEFVLMAMLALGHKVPSILHNQRYHEWPPDRFARLVPKELRDSTIALIGYGSIAREIARITQPFGVKILAAKRDVMKTEDTGFTQEGLGDPKGDLFTRLYPIQAIRSMLKECDFIVNTLPKTKDTENIIAEDEFLAMKPTAYLIDVSRGGIVKSLALKSALHEKKIAGAFLDVFEQEPLLKDNPLWDTPNLIISPHIAGISLRYNERALKLIQENLKRYIEDEPLLNLFNWAEGY